jgi:hypothetical protein
MNYSPLKNSSRALQVGEKAYLTSIQVKSSDIVFSLQTCPADANEAPFRASLTFQFQKGYLDTMDFKQIQETISNVFAIDADISAQGQTNSQPAAMSLEQVTGVYVIPHATANRLQLNSDGTFSLVEAGRNHSGTFTVEGDKLMMRTGNRALPAAILRGDTILDPDGPTWVKQGGAPAAVAPAGAPLKLPSTYVGAQTPADQLHLNADNSFSLQEAGQSYRGTFVASGNTLELNISETNTKTTVTIQGSNLTDSSGQTWVLREQPPPVPGAGVLQNQDIIKMAKAGFDDAIIVAKIGSSKCQFDTSTDALIQLKESGVSAAVLKVMVGAGR